MSVVTRFPPSPTGFMHIGNARTALFNWLFAKNKKGKMLLRIEDTDRARHSEKAVQAIIDGLNWMDLSWDGDIVSQHARAARHVEVANELLAKGQAYKCYCSQEELEEMRKTAQEEGRATYYNRKWRDKPESEAPEGVDPVIRIKAPLSGETTIDDQVQGTITLNNEQLDDFILLRSDGTPTYMLAVVVDDHDMGVTHVLRGDDHMSNAFRQSTIIDGMGWDRPIYAHLPMILGQDGAKLSKRHGAVSLEDFKEMGYVPDAVFNYLLRLGWSHGDDEIISREQAIEWFGLEAIGKSPAKFDYDKLEKLNAHYIKEMETNRFVKALADYNITFGAQHNDFEATVTPLASELQNRATTLKQALLETAFLFNEGAPDEDAQKMLSETPTEIIDGLIKSFSELSDFTSENIQNACKELSKELVDGKMGKIGMPLRAALTGTLQSPSVFLCAETLGQQACLERLNSTKKYLS